MESTVFRHALNRQEQEHPPAQGQAFSKSFRSQGSLNVLCALFGLRVTCSLLACWGVAGFPVSVNGKLVPGPPAMAGVMMGLFHWPGLKVTIWFFPEGRSKFSAN